MGYGLVADTASVNHGGDSHVIQKNARRSGQQTGLIRTLPHDFAQDRKLLSKSSRKLN
jgi:hypothetical protein